MISTVIVPFALVIFIDFVAIIYSTGETPYLDDSQNELDTYKTSMRRIKNNTIVFLLLVLNLAAGYLAWIPSTSYVAQPILCFFSVLFGFALCFLFIVRKPMTYPKEYLDDAKSKRSSSTSSDSIKKAKRHSGKKSVSHVSKNQHYPQIMATENEYIDDDQLSPNRHTQHRQPEHQTSRTQFNIDSRSHADQSFSSLIGNGRRTAYFDPQSIPMSNANRKRYTNYGYSDDRYGYDNHALEDDDYF